jgi:hypothetical protein
MGLTHFPNPIHSRDNTFFFIEKALNLALNMLAHYKLSFKAFRFYRFYSRYNKYQKKSSLNSSTINNN